MLKINTEQEAYRVAHAVGQDAGSRNMRKNGRSMWNEEDWEVASQVFNRVYKSIEKQVQARPEHMPEIITTKKAAEIIGVKPGRVSQFVQEGRLTPYMSTGRQNFFLLSEVREFAQVKRKVGNPGKRKGRGKVADRVRK